MRLWGFEHNPHGGGKSGAGGNNQLDMLRRLNYSRTTMQLTYT
jgi:hypothetical protein